MQIECPIGKGELTSSAQLIDWLEYVSVLEALLKGEIRQK